MRSRGSSLSTLILLAVGNLWAQQPQTQRVNGQVRDHAGAPVPNARIRAVPLAAPGGARANALAAVDGSFALTGLPAGLYQLCADVPGAELLDPCLWDRQPTPVTVRDLPLNGMSLQLKRGATLSVRVDDPGRSLVAAERSGKGHLLVGVWSANGAFHPARVTAEDARGRTYSLAVPAGVAGKLSVTPSGLRLQDAAGKAAVGAGSIDFELPPAGQVFRYTVLP